MIESNLRVSISEDVKSFYFEFLLIHLK